MISPNIADVLMWEIKILALLLLRDIFVNLLLRYGDFMIFWTNYILAGMFK